MRFVGGSERYVSCQYNVYCMVDNGSFHQPPESQHPHSYSTPPKKTWFSRIFTLIYLGPYNGGV